MFNKILFSPFILLLFPFFWRDVLFSVFVFPFDQRTRKQYLYLTHCQRPIKMSVNYRNRSPIHDCGHLKRQRFVSSKLSPSQDKPQDKEKHEEGDDHDAILPGYRFLKVQPYFDLRHLSFLGRNHTHRWYRL